MLTSQEWILGQANADKEHFPISTPNKVEKAESKLEKEQNKTIERRLTDNFDGFRIGLRITVHAGEQRNLPQTYPRKTRLKCPVLLKPSLRFSKATQDMTSPPPSPFYVSHLQTTEREPFLTARMGISRKKERRKCREGKIDEEKRCRRGRRKKKRERAIQTDCLRRRRRRRRRQTPLKHF